MDRIEINTPEEFYDYKLRDLTHNLNINFEFPIPFPIPNVVQGMRYNRSLKFNDCKFLKGIKLNSNGPLTNDDGKVISESTLEFINCTIEEKLIAEDSILDCKVRFRNCDFVGDVNFRNTSFKQLADFWKCTFHQPTTFYKTDFWDITVFSAVTFKENVLFTYSLIDKLMILRGANPEKGFDISLAIIAGQMNVYDFRMDDYKSYGEIYKKAAKYSSHKNAKSYNDVFENLYENAVSSNHQIPLENKRETYRILKSQLESQKNFIDAVPYRVMENKTLLKESWKKLINGHTFSRPISNIIVLFLNGISNWFGQSYILGFIFTAIVGGLFFTWMLSYIGSFEYTTDVSQWQWQYYVQYLNPTHRADFMKAVDKNPSQGFYILDFIGRIFIGYGIYQIIQAFRKYK